MNFRVIKRERQALSLSGAGPATRELGHEPQPMTADQHRRRAGGLRNVDASDQIGPSVRDAGLVETSVKIEGGAYQGDVGEGLWKVAEMLATWSQLLAV